MSTQQITTVQSIRPEVTRNAEGHRITTTLNVAEVFGKLHKDVLKSLNNLECSEQFSRRNFAPRDYLDSRGKTYPMFEMTERGFSMLAMSFTGKNAMYWKEAFIEALRLEGHHICAHPSDGYLLMSILADKLEQSLPEV